MTLPYRSSAFLGSIVEEASPERDAEDAARQEVLIFLLETPATLESILVALESGDNALLELNAHALKTKAHCVRAMELYRNATRLEEAARRGDVEASETAFQAVSDEYHRLTNELAERFDYVFERTS
jgi:HPt (histidine-containing phosphotransfer) domain-containing protein